MEPDVARIAEHVIDAIASLSRADRVAVLALAAEVVGDLRVVDSYVEPKKRKKEKPPTEDEKRVVERVNAARATRIPGDTGFRCTATSVRFIRARLADYTVDELLLVVDWWAQRPAVRGWNPLEYLNLDTPFRPTRFPSHLGSARAWRAGTTSRRAVDTTVQDFERRLAVERA